MGGKHSLLSPSKLEQVLGCIGSLAACKGIESGPATEDSASGTLTHQVSEYVLKGGMPPRVGQLYKVEGFTFTIDDDRLTRMWDYVDAIRREPGTKFYEVNLDTSVVLGVDDQSGTADCVQLDEGLQQLSVHDLKDGAGIIEAKDNPQLITYGAAALRAYDFLDWKYLRVVIHQPRMKHYSEHVYTVDDVRVFMAGVKAVAQKAYELWAQDVRGDELMKYLEPGEKQCRWCLVRSGCPARAKAVLDLFPTTNADEPPLNLLDDAAIASAWFRLGEIENWCRDIRAEAHKRLLAGHKLPGLKLIDGRKGARKWIDPKQAETALSFMLDEDKLYKPRELISPTEAGKLLKKDLEALAGYITQSDGAKSVAPEDDPAPGITVDMPEFGLAP